MLLEFYYQLCYDLFRVMLARIQPIRVTTRFQVSTVTPSGWGVGSVGIGKFHRELAQRNLSNFFGPNLSPFFQFCILVAMANLLNVLLEQIHWK